MGFGVWGSLRVLGGVGFGSWELEILYDVCVGFWLFRFQDVRSLCSLTLDPKPLQPLNPLHPIPGALSLRPAAPRAAAAPPGAHLGVHRPGARRDPRRRTSWQLRVCWGLGLRVAGVAFRVCEGCCVEGAIEGMFMKVGQTRA